MRAVQWLPAVLITGAAFGFFAFDLKPVSQSVGSTVVRKFSICGSAQQRHCVVDGDTIRYGGNIIRLEDIDTPEIRSAKCPSEKKLGERAKRRLLVLVNSAPIKSVYTGGRDEDRYGRKLRVIKIDGHSVGDTLVAEGL
ncbi:MAG: thermonuclease family protein, partial [Alphaproteobacteria bacterium]